MNYLDQNRYSNDSGDGSGVSPAETTLRLIASLPAPEGLEDRVRAGLVAAPRLGRILAWPRTRTQASGWVRSAAAAAIVFVVAGGGWGIYSRVQPGQPARVMALPPHGSASGGFSSSGAMRTPQTLNGPVVANPVAAQASRDKAPTKPAAPKTPNTKPTVVNKTSTLPAAPAVK